MFDQRSSAGPAGPAGMASRVASWPGLLPGAEPADDDAGRIDEIEALERAKSAICARQAQLTAVFAASQRDTQRKAGVREAEVGRGIASQVGLARHDSPVKGARHVGLAAALAEMPETLAALQRGDTSEWRATMIARETACLSREDRAAVDADLGPLLGAYGDRQTCAEARKRAYALDPAAALRRTAKAEADRRVSLRPAPDTMAYLTGLLPVRDGVAAHASLTRHADAAKAAGDPRSRGQIMADELTARLTGQACADDTDVDLMLVVGAEALAAAPTDEPNPEPDTEPDAKPDAGTEAATYEEAEATPRPDPETGTGTATDAGDCEGSADRRAGEAVGPTTAEAARFRDSPAEPAGLGDDPAATRAAAGPTDPANQPGWLTGYGPVPAWWARRLIRETTGRVWLRRAFAHPGDGTLVQLESARRLFPEPLRKALIVRDQACRTPWCDAPIRHVDHITPATDGGPTSLANGQGLCQACNLAKTAPGWKARPSPIRGTTEIETTTPTGHTYHSDTPSLPGRDGAANAPPQAA